MKKLRQRIAVCGLIACSVGVVPVSWARKVRTITIDERRDAPLQTIWLTPHGPPYVSQRVGGLLGNTYQWRVYPFLGVSFDGSRKWFQLAVELHGDSYAVMLPGTSMVFTFDGKQYTLPDIYSYNIGGGGCSVNVFDQFSCVNIWVISPKTDEERQSLETLMRLLSAAHEVYVTLVGGPGTNRFSVQLTDQQMAVVRRVLDEYERLCGAQLHRR